MDDDNDSPFFLKKEVCRLIKLGPAHIDRLERAGRFPKRLNLTGTRNGKVAWLKSEILEWCLQRTRRTLKPPPADISRDSPPDNRPGLH